MEEKHYDLIVVGGGIAGSWISYLAQTHRIRTLLISRDPLEKTTSWMSGGILSPHAEGLEGELRRQGIAGIRAYEELIAEVPHPPSCTFGYGVLLPFTEEDPYEPFLLYLEKYPDTPREHLPPEELEKHIGLTDRILGGIYLPRDAYIDPRFVLKTLRDLFLRKGGELLLEEVLQIQKGPVVRTEKRRISSSWLVLATGAFAPPLPAPAKISGDRGIIVRISHPKPLPYLLYHHGKRATTYIVPDPSGVRLGSTSQQGDPRTDVDPVELGDLLLRGGALWKGLAQGRFTEVGVGFRPFFPDSPYPQILPLEESVFWVSGFHRNGVLLAPAFAGTLVNNLLSGRSLPIPGG